jgi:tol-pal system protein YbgF
MRDRRVQPGPDLDRGCWIKVGRLFFTAALVIGAAAPVHPQQSESVAPPADMYLLPEGDAFALYDRGFGLLRRGDWAGAEEAFREILQRFPNDELAPNARYWLAETYLQRGDARRAAETFHEVYQAAPQSARAPDALYKEGVALERAGDHYGACLTYRKLKQVYPIEALRYPVDERC